MNKLQLSLLCLAFLSACSGKPDVHVPAKARVKADYTFAVEASEPCIIKSTGYIKKPENYLVAAQLSGTIKELRLKKGSPVLKGQVLAQLKDVQFEEKLEQVRLEQSSLEGRIKELESAAKVAAENFSESGELYADSLLSEDQLTLARLESERLDAAIERNKIQFIQSQKEQVLLQKQRGFLVLSAPVKGVITEIFRKEGESILTGQPILTIKPDDEEKIFITKLSDKDISRLSLSDTATVWLDALEGSSIGARLSFIPAQNIDNSPFFEVQLSLEEKNENILPGYFGKAEIYCKSGGQILAIPPTAMISASKERGAVFILENGKAYKKEIRITSISDSLLFVSGPIDSRDTILLNTNGIIQEGDAIQTEK